MERFSGSFGDPRRFPRSYDLIRDSPTIFVIVARGINLVVPETVSRASTSPSMTSTVLPTDDELMPTDKELAPPEPAPPMMLEAPVTTLAAQEATERDQRHACRHRQPAGARSGRRPA